MLSRKVKLILITLPTILVLGLVFVVWRAKPPRKPTSIKKGDYSQAIRYAEQKIKWVMDGYHLPSVAVALIDDQDTIWDEAFGIVNFEEDTPASTDTVYKVWSVAKMFTALETMRLVEEGLIDLDAPITDYLPEFSIQSRFPDSGPITVRSILTHRSGLPRNECHWIEYIPDALPSLVTSLEDCYQTYPVGERYKYSNIGFDLLGHLIAQLRGKSFPEAMRENLLLPVGMEHSAFLRAQVPAGLAHASGYEYYQGEYYPLEQNDSNETPSGNLYSTIEDMAVFAKFIFRSGEANGEQIVSPETLELMYTDQPWNSTDPQPMGLGWKTAVVLGSERLLWHDGGPGEGIGALVALLPQRELGVILFANSTAFEGNLALPIALDMLEVMLKAKYNLRPPKTAAQQEVELDRSQLGKFVGKYASFGQVLEVTLKGDQLKASLGGFTFNLNPLSATAFQPQHWLASLGLLDLIKVPFDLRQMKFEFMLGDQNQVDRLVINFADFFFETCPRYPDREAIPAQWEKLTGEYDLLPRLPSGETGVNVLGDIRIYVQDGVLQVAGYVGPIIPISERELIILSGSFAGETMEVELGKGTITHQSIVYRLR